MAVAHTTVGFKGTVDQSGEAQRLSLLGVRGAVRGSTDWIVASATGDRTVSISAGVGFACAVRDTTTAIDTVQLAANGSGATRFDMVVARFIWNDPVTPVVFTSVAGIPGAGGPNINALVRTPGTQYDLVLAVVRVAAGQGTLNANDIFDCRCWGVSGPLQVATVSPSLLTAVDATEVVDLATRRHLRKVASTWTKLSGPRELLYDQPNGPQSGLINVGAGPTGVISVPLAAPAVALDTAHLHGVLGILSTGATVGTLTVQIAGVSYSQIFNVRSVATATFGSETKSIQLGPIPVVLDFQVTIPANTYQIAVLINPTAGNSCSVDYSSLRLIG